MPGMNGTGPQGQGPGTGRGAGQCAAGTVRNNMPEADSIGQGNNRGCGMGRGGRKKGRNSGCGNRGRMMGKR